MVERKLVPWAAVFASEWTKNTALGSRRTEMDKQTIISVIIDFLNKEGKQGFQFKTMIESKFIDYGYAFLLEKGEPIQYDFTLLDKEMQDEVDSIKKKGTSIGPDNFISVVDDLDIVGSIYIPTLNYELNQEGLGVTKPVYLTRVKTNVEEVVEEKHIDLYEKETGKKAKVGKNLTKDFKEWLKNIKE